MEVDEDGCVTDDTLSQDELIGGQSKTLTMQCLHCVWGLERIGDRLETKCQELSRYPRFKIRLVVRGRNISKSIQK